jgi:hypothetical protein
MKFFSFITIISLFSFSNGNVSRDCAIEVAQKVTIESGGAKVTLNASGGIAPYRYIFSSESGVLLSENFENNSVNGLASGTYSCTVVDTKNCRKAVKIKIQ